MSYASVNGVDLYYEEHGSGQPLVLVHGGLGSGEMFGPILPMLAEGRRVIMVDLQAHGRTADIDRPLRYESLGDDLAGLIEHLGLAQSMNGWLRSKVRSGLLQNSHSGSLTVPPWAPSDPRGWRRPRRGDRDGTDTGPGTSRLAWSP